MITQAQRIMLFGLLKGAKIPQSQRAAFTASVLGEPVSWTALTESQVDKLRRRLLILAKPNNIARGVEDAAAEERGERKRLLWTVNKLTGALGLVFGTDGLAYRRKILVDLYDRADLLNLSNEQLDNVKKTLRNRLGKLLTACKNGKEECALELNFDLSNQALIDVLFSRIGTAEAEPFPSVGIDREGDPF